MPGPRPRGRSSARGETAEITSAGQLHRHGPLRAAPASRLNLSAIALPWEPRRPGLWNFPVILRKNREPSQSGFSGSPRGRRVRRRGFSLTVLFNSQSWRGFGLNLASNCSARRRPPALPDDEKSGPQRSRLMRPAVSRLTSWWPLRMRNSALLIGECSK